MGGAGELVDGGDSVRMEEDVVGDEHGRGMGGGTALEEKIAGASSSLAMSVEGVSEGSGRRSSGGGE